MRFIRKKWIAAARQKYPPAFSTHMANPVAFNLANNQVRIFFSGRNEEKKSSIGYFDILIDQTICQASELHTLVDIKDHKDSFFADGISLGNIFAWEGRHFLSFMGWQRLGESRWAGRIGLMELNPFTPSIQSVPNEPIIDISKTYGASLSYPAVKVMNGSRFFWYGSTIKPDAGNGEMLHSLHLTVIGKTGEQRHYGEIIKHEIGTEQAFSRPCVIETDGGLSMFYSVRGSADTYQIKSATSLNGKSWQKADFELLGPEFPEETEMQCYPYLFGLKDDLFMLYNGNGFGKSGIGIAVMER